MENAPIIDLASFNALSILGIITLIGYIVLIPAVIYLSKKTDFFKNLNAWIDKKLGDEMPQETPSNPEPSPASPEAQAVQTDVQDEQELDKEGVASFRLRVKDFYYCRLSYKNKTLRSHAVSWLCSNQFIGKVEPNGLFTGTRAGTVTISCMATGASLDEAQQMYRLQVVPSNQDWFAENIINALFKGTKQDILEASLSEARKIVSEKPNDRVVIFEGGPSDKKLSLQFNSYKELVRALFEVRDNSQAGYNKLVQELDERFEEVKLSKGVGLRVWAHQRIDDYDEEIDFYAFIRTTINHTYLGFGRFWREYGSIEEFKLNIRLAEAMFQDLLPGVKPEEVEAQEPPKPQKPAEPVKQTPPVEPQKSLNEEQQREEPVQTPEPEPEPANQPQTPPDPEETPGGDEEQQEETETPQEPDADASEGRPNQELDFGSDARPSYKEFEDSRE